MKNIDGSRKTESIFNKIAIANSLKDTAKIDFYEGNQEIQSGEIKYLSDIFCDNILLYLITELDKKDEEKKKTIDDDDELGKKQIINFLKDQNLELYKDFKMKSLRIEIVDIDKKIKNKI